MQLEGKLNDFKDKGRIIFKELVPYQQLQYEIGRVDLNIIPLVNNSFNQSKSELKYFESGILKVPSCVTPTELYKKIITDKENGIFCKPGEWFLNIEKLYLQPKLLKKIGENAYKNTIDKYLPETQTKIIEQAYEKILKVYIKNE